MQSFVAPTLLANLSANVYGSSPNCMAGVQPIVSENSAILGKFSTLCGESSSPDSNFALDNDLLTKSLDSPLALTSKDAFCLPPE